MSTVKITIINNSSKHVTYKNGSSSGNLPPGSRRETNATIGSTFLFENDYGAKYIISENDQGKTFKYDR